MNRRRFLNDIGGTFVGSVALADSAVRKTLERAITPSPPKLLPSTERTIEKFYQELTRAFERLSTVERQGDWVAMVALSCRSGCDTCPLDHLESLSPTLQILGGPRPRSRCLVVREEDRALRHSITRWLVDETTRESRRRLIVTGEPLETLVSLITPPHLCRRRVMAAAIGPEDLGQLTERLSVLYRSGLDLIEWRHFSRMKSASQGSMERYARLLLIDTPSNPQMEFPLGAVIVSAEMTVETDEWRTSFREEFA